MYEQYERKMQRIAAFIRRYRIALIAAVLVLLAGVFFVFGVGVTWNEVSCRSVVYGQQPEPEASSSVSKIVYEYRSVSEDEDWSEEVPKDAGEYEVRATSVSVFGIRRSAGKATFTIRPKRLVISYEGDEVYSNTQETEVNASRLRADGLEYGDKLSGNFSWDESPANNGGRTIFPSFAEIVHKNGSIANDCYEIEYNPGTIKDGRIRLILVTGSLSVKYSGNPKETVSCDKISVQGGSLKEGHTLEAHCVTKVSGFGSKENKLDDDNVRIVDADGKDVTGQYIIEIRYGTVSFDRRIISISSESAEKDYDGTPLTKEGFTIGGDGLADGDHLDAKCLGTRTEPGVSNNDFAVFSIQSDTYGDVTDCYEISEKYGKLKINYPEDGTIAGTDENEFDLTHEGGLRSGNNGSGNKTVLFGFRGQTRRMYYFRENNYMYYDGHTWKNPEGGVQYEPEAEYLTGGALWDGGYQLDRVLIRKLRLNHRIYPYFMAWGEDESTESYYEYSCDAYTLGYEDTFDYPYHYDTQLLNKYSEYVWNHYMDVPDNVRKVLLELGNSAGIRADSMTLIQDIADYISTAAVYDLDHPAFPQNEDLVIYFLTKSKRGICQHYASAATMMYRTYGIPARFVVGFVAQGKANQWVEVDTDAGHAWVEVFLEGTGWVPVEVTGSGGNNGNTGGISGGLVDGGDGGGDYRADVVIGFETYSKEYDGLPVHFTDPSWYIIEGSLAPGDTVYVPKITIDAPPEAGITREDVDVRILDSSGRDVTYEYSFGMYLPYVEIKKREITIATYGMTVEEGDGPARNNRWYISKGSLASGDTIEIQITAVQDTVGRRQNWPDYVRIYNEKQEEVTEMYNISYKPGYLEVISE
ncbi:MAG: transglutaminase domain-containing protein [Lachnospiraceae bacterium]|nr:transglutaminase domain-containing protein [Lachnospiraceae bacterium]